MIGANTEIMQLLARGGFSQQSGDTVMGIAALGAAVASGAGLWFARRRRTKD
jgi:LPXTG-motif cell wall-anchored protein